MEARLERLPAKVVGNTWLWGVHRFQGAANATNGSLGENSTGENRTVEMFLGRLLTGETGVVVCNHLHQPIASRPITVRAEQAKLLGAARLSDGQLMGMATGPNRVLHLFTADLRRMDKVSFNAKILGATLIPWDGDLKLIVALESEVSCWSIDVPDAIPAVTRPK